MGNARETRELRSIPQGQVDRPGAGMLVLAAGVSCALGVAAWFGTTAPEEEAVHARLKPVPAATVVTAEPLTVVSAAPAAPSARAIRCFDEALRGAVGTSAWIAGAQREPAPEGGPLPALRTPAEATDLPAAQLAYLRDGALRVRSLPGGRERIIVGADRGPREARWSPAGTQLAFLARDPGTDERADDHVYVVSGDGSPVRVSDRAARGRPSFASDGSRIAFAAEDDSVVVVDIDGSNERRFETVGRVEAGPVFAPTNDSVYFADEGAAAASASALARINLSNGKTKRLEAPDMGRAFSMAFVDGDLLLGGEWRLDPRAENHLFRLPARAPSVLRDAGSLVSTYDGGYTTVVAAPQGKRYVRATRIFAKVFTRDGDNDVANRGNWQRQDLFVVDGPKPPSHYFTTANEPFPQPRVETGEAAFGPDARHLAFDVALLDFEGATHDSQRLAEGIVAVDLDQPKAPPVFLACGTAPQWAPMPRGEAAAVVAP